MADKPEEKSQPAPAQAPAKQPEKNANPPRATKLVEETGRYVCKSGITFTNEKGERAHAKKGDVVAVADEDAKYLKKLGAIVEETREE